MKFLEGIARRMQQKRKTGIERYRQLLEKVIDNDDLPAKDQSELEGLMQSLDRGPERVAADLEILRQHREMKAGFGADVLAAAQKTTEAAERKLREWNEEQDRQMVIRDAERQAMNAAVFNAVGESNRVQFSNRQLLDLEEKHFELLGLPMPASAAKAQARRGARGDFPETNVSTFAYVPDPTQHKPPAVKPPPDLKKFPLDDSGEPWKKLNG